MNDRPAYSRRFFEQQREGSRRSSEAIVPLVLDLLPIQSVVDVGCGPGSWLAEFEWRGVRDVCGIDGDYVDRSMLEISPERFLAQDLSVPFRLNRRFDLVVSLDVAEHLLAAAADTFVESLPALGDAILFSAAVQHQGGNHHVNEQWPEYWHDRFRERNFSAIDRIRGRVWDDESVDYWHAQNTLLYIRREELARHPHLQREAKRTLDRQLSVVHPRQFLGAAEREAELRAWLTLSAIVPLAGTYILVGREQYADAGPLPDRRALPFLERAGEFWGYPEDDATAIRELERLRAAGAAFIVYPRPAHWWLGQYTGLRKYLRSRFSCTLEREALIAFDLRTHIANFA